MQDQGGDEDWHVYAQEVAAGGGAARDLTPFKGVRAENLLTNRRHPDVVSVHTARCMQCPLCGGL